MRLENLLQVIHVRENTAFKDVCGMLIPITYEYVIMRQKGIKVADGITAANQMTLK